MKIPAAIYEKFIRPALFSMDPEAVHELAMGLLAGALPPAPGLCNTKLLSTRATIPASERTVSRPEVSQIPCGLA